VEFSTFMTAYTSFWLITFKWIFCKMFSGVEISILRFDVPTEVIQNYTYNWGLLIILQAYGNLKLNVPTMAQKGQMPFINMSSISTGRPFPSKLVLSIFSQRWTFPPVFSRGKISRTNLKYSSNTVLYSHTMIYCIYVWLMYVHIRPLQLWD
jgi:hypothetical protein